MTRRSRSCQSSSRYGAYIRSFVSALTIAEEALGCPPLQPLCSRCAFQQKSTALRGQEVATMPAYERRQVQWGYPRRAILGWENEPRTPYLVRCPCAQKQEILAIISMTRCCACPHYQQNKRPSWVPGILMSSSGGASENKGLIYQSGKRRRRRPPEQTLCKHTPPSLCLLADSADASGILP